MSDAMTSGEIEDVLSSIRRLVSEDLRPASKPGTASLVKEDHGKLLLTPALRVLPGVPPEPEERDIPVEAQPAPDQVLGEPELSTARDARALPLLALADADPAEVGGPEAKDDQPWPPVHAMVIEPAAEDPWEADAIAEQPETAEAPEPFEPQDAPTDIGADEVIGKIGATLNTDGPTWEPETGDTVPVTRLSWIDVAEDTPDERETTPPPRFVHRAEIPLDTSSEITAAEDSALIGTTEEVLDEAVLREIVRAVLREELQGHLGERITRNIRKLVRAEINRSLTLRDYE